MMYLLIDVEISRFAGILIEAHKGPGSGTHRPPRASGSGGRARVSTRTPVSGRWARSLM